MTFFSSFLHFSGYWKFIYCLVGFLGTWGQALARMAGVWKLTLMFLPRTKIPFIWSNANWAASGCSNSTNAKPWERARVRIDLGFNFEVSNVGPGPLPVSVLTQCQKKRNDIWPCVCLSWNPSSWWCFWSGQMWQRLSLSPPRECHSWYSPHRSCKGHKLSKDY